MAANPIGNETKTIDINMSEQMADDLTKRAESMLLSASEYCEIILLKWVESGERLKLKEHA